jgi:hypothetical protein
MGRICPGKGLHNAIEIAARAGIALKIAAKVDKADPAYYNFTIKCLRSVEFIGEIGKKDRGDPVALLFPIDWPSRSA